MSASWGVSWIREKGPQTRITEAIAPLRNDVFFFSDAQERNSNQVGTEERLYSPQKWGKKVRPKNRSCFSLYSNQLPFIVSHSVFSVRVFSFPVSWALFGFGSEKRKEKKDRTDSGDSVSSIVFSLLFPSYHIPSANPLDSFFLLTCKS